MKSKYGRIDYSRRSNDRRKLTNYLRTGSFRNTNGATYYSKEAIRARILLVVVASIVCAVGFYHVIF